jgi:hypothetical protein
MFVNYCHLLGILYVNIAYLSVKFEGFIAVKTHNPVIRVMMLYSVIGGHQSYHPEDWDILLLQNVGTHQLDYINQEDHSSHLYTFTT